MAGVTAVVTTLAIGSPGDVLIVNSAGTAPEWAAQSALRHIWQLGGNTAPSSNILGTLDATDIDIRTDNSYTNEP